MTWEAEQGFGICRKCGQIDSLHLQLSSDTVLLVKIPLQCKYGESAQSTA